MGRKRLTNYQTAGRPPKDPANKVGTPIRCLVTEGVALRMAELSTIAGIPNPSKGLVSSDIVRLAVYEFLKRKGALEGLEEDYTWESLKITGLV